MGENKMKHMSLKMETPCEVINVTPCNPLISKCQIKVCYVGDEPNRNRCIISKETAREMANSLPGSPIVGYYNSKTKDFEEHNRTLEITEDGKFIAADDTRPYGFVDLNAKCWFQKFLDDGQNEHEYLMTEGYIWTGQYPEASRIIEKGNNQSMELDDKLINATWTKDENGKHTFFIINEAIISKLCILGEDYEPCFEGSSITKLEFSLGDDFKQELFSMMKQMQEILNKGGEKPMLENETKGSEAEVDLNKAPQINENNTEFKAAPKAADEKADEKKEEKDKADKSDNEESEDNSEDKKSDSSKKDEEKPADDEKKPADKADDKAAEEEDKKKKKKYSFEEIPEYTELVSKYSALEKQYNDLKAEKETLDFQITELNNFKLNVEREKKQDMINNTFYMLSNEDKKDVIDNIDKYSLDDIEAKLSILCVRNKVSFAALEDEHENKGTTTFNINDTDSDDSVPAWIKAVLDTVKTLN